MSLTPPVRNTFANGAKPSDASLVAFYEGLIGIGTAARVCQHLLHQDTIDIAELRAMVQSIIATSDTAIAILRD